MQHYTSKSGMRRHGMMPDGFVRTDDENGLRYSMHATPDDDTARLVYADWLADNGRQHAEARLRWWVKARRALRDNVLNAEGKQKTWSWVAAIRQQEDLGLPTHPRDDPATIIVHEFQGVRPEWVQRLLLVELVRYFGDQYDVVKYRPLATLWEGHRLHNPAYNELGLQRSLISLPTMSGEVVRYTPEQLADLEASRNLLKIADCAYAQLLELFTTLITRCLDTAEEFALHLASVAERSEARRDLTETVLRFSYTFNNVAFVPRRTTAAARCANNSLHGTTAPSALRELSDMLTTYGSVSDRLAIGANIDTLTIAAIREVRRVISEESPTKRLG